MNTGDVVRMEACAAVIELKRLCSSNVEVARYELVVEASVDRCTTPDPAYTNSDLTMYTAFSAAITFFTAKCASVTSSSDPFIGS